MKLAIIALGVILFFSLAAASATTYLVRPDGTGDFPTIQAAINAVVPDDVVELTDGTFVGDGNRDIDYLGKAITLRSRSNDPEACAIDCAAGPGDRHRGFRFHMGEPSAARLQGVTIRNGYVTSAQGGGGAILRTSGSPTIENCIMEDNYGEGGGGLRARFSGHVTVTACIFRRNTAGPAISAETCSLTVTDCVCENHQDGGGLDASNAAVVLNRCTFRSNHMDSGGGGLNVSGGMVSATDCRFESNQSSAISFPRSGGGGARVSHADAVFETCDFVGNTVTFVSPYGFGGGLYATASNLVVRTCSFRNNQALRGGGVGLDACDPLLDQCTFTGNQSPYGGGALCLDAASPSVTHTIMAFNLNGNAVWCMGAEAPQLDCCDIYGNAGGDWIGCIEGQYGTQGNLCEDPLFCDLAAGNLNLMPESPCAPNSPWNPECGLIGAFPVGCDPQAAWDIPVASGAALWSAPNPFVGGTTIAYRLGPGCRDAFSIAIYDVAGRIVRTLRAPELTGQLRWDGTDDAGRTLPGGVYLLRLAGNERTVTERVVRIR